MPDPLRTIVVGSYRFPGWLGFAAAVARECECERLGQPCRILRAGERFTLTTPDDRV